MTNHTIGAFIASKTVGDLVKELKPRSDLVNVPSSETLESVFDILLANDILSVPVYKEDSKPKEYLGFVSVLDLVRLVADSVRLSDIVGNFRDVSRPMLISNKFLFFGGQQQHTLETLQSNPDFLLQPVSLALGKMGKGQSEMSVKATDPLSSMLGRLSHDLIHRVLVWSDQQDEPVVISQRDLLCYFHAHNHELGKILDTSASSLTMAALGDHQVTLQTINFRHTAWEAFHRIASLTPWSAIAVIDDAGFLVTEISAADLRGLNRARIQDLDRPIVTFLKGSHGEDGILPLTCHVRFTLQQVMAALVLGQAHRIWLCDADDRVEGVVTLSDVLTAFNNSSGVNGLSQ